MSKAQYDGGGGYSMVHLIRLLAWSHAYFTLTIVIIGGVYHQLIDIFEYIGFYLFLLVVRGGSRRSASCTVLYEL